MPRISDERREARREQILQAARACLQEHGLEAVSMEMIIASSGLSTGAVYGYFKGKGEIISALVTDGTAKLGERLVPILRNPEPPPLPELAAQLLRAIVDIRRAGARHRSPARLACTAGVTPRAIPNSRRHPAPPTAGCANCSPTR